MNCFANYGQQQDNSRSFMYKTKIIGRTPANYIALDTEVAAQFKYLSNFWRSFDFPVITCDIELELSWSKHRIISAILNNTEVPVNTAANQPIEHNP